MARNAYAENVNADKGLSLQRVQLKKVGFEMPFRIANINEIAWDNVDVFTQRNVGDRLDNRFELTLVLYVNATSLDGEMVFRAIVEEVGVLKVTGYPEEEIADLLRTKGAEMIYPYAREFILSMIGRAGIPQFSLKPMTFELPDGP